MRHRPASTEKIIDDLIQQRNGIELPAGGAWTIAPGQSMWAERLGPGRARRIGLRTASGALTVSTDLVKVTLTLGLVARDGTATPRTIGFEGDLGFADRVGRWRFDGRSTVDGASSACVLALDYQGVHARGATPVAWLTIVEALVTHGRGRRGRPGRLRLEGHLNAGRQGDPDDGSLPRPVPTSETVSPEPVPGFDDAVALDDCDAVGSGRLIMFRGQ